MNENGQKRPVGLLLRIFRKLRKERMTEEPFDFTSEGDYWETRYAEGGSSGQGSVGASRSWKWSIIEQYVDVRTKSVLDVGCGDLTFWQDRNCESYVGLDFSETIVSHNQSKRPSWQFIQGNASDSRDILADIVFCMDLLFHVMSEGIFESILRNLSSWTGEFLFVYNWRRSPFGESNTDNRYQYFRPLPEYASLLAPLKLVGEHRYDEIGSLYVFRRVS